MKPLTLIAAVACLAFVASTGLALAEEPLLHGHGPLPSTDSEVATWLSFRYDAMKEAAVSLPGQKDFQSWLVGGRCNWLEGLNLAAGYEIWAPNPEAGKEIRTTRGAVSYQRQNKGAALSLERSSYGDAARAPSYGAIAAFTMQF
jgi:hypothetical protein